MTHFKHILMKWVMLLKDSSAIMCKKIHFSIQFVKPTFIGNEASILEIDGFVMDQEIHEEMLVAITLITDINI